MRGEESGLDLHRVEDKDFNPVFTNTQPTFAPPQGGPGWAKMGLRLRWCEELARKLRSFSRISGLGPDAARPTGVFEDRDFKPHPVCAVTLRKPFPEPSAGLSH